MNILNDHFDSQKVYKNNLDDYDRHLSGRCDWEKCPNSCYVCKTVKSMSDEFPFIDISFIPKLRCCYSGTYNFTIDKVKEIMFE
jgi:hypothetical protein